METTVRVVWPKPVHTTKASMKALRVRWLTLSSIMPTRSTKKKKLAHVEMVKPNCAMTGMANFHHCRRVSRHSAFLPMNEAGCM